MVTKKPSKKRKTKTNKKKLTFNIVGDVGFFQIFFKHLNVYVGYKSEKKRKKQIANCAIGQI